MCAAPHPPIVHRPAALWRGAASDEGPLSDNPAVWPYRPEWLARARLGPVARAVAFQHPACALALLVRRYAATAESIEPALSGSGEAVFHLLGWAERAGVRLRRPEAFYRDILIRDGYWGWRHARRSRDPALLRDVDAWAAAARHDSGAAAALFLMRHPREAVRPYLPTLKSNPFYAYVALPRLHHRGLEMGAEDVPDPKWACHFGQSVFARDRGDYAARVAADPAWAVEWIAARHETSADQRAAWMKRLERASSGHVLLKTALGWLRQPAPSCPAALASGRAAETTALQSLGRTKNRGVWRPTAEQIRSEDFKRIVGPPQFTERGWPRGTVVDAADDTELAEIKSGHSPLVASYQLRLQAFRARAEARPLKIYTSRPVQTEFAQWLEPLGVDVEPLP